jgi:hypothetical protein
MAKSILQRHGSETGERSNTRTGGVPTAPESPVLQVDGGTDSVRFPCNLRGQKMTRYPQQVTAMTYVLENNNFFAISLSNSLDLFSFLCSFVLSTQTLMPVSRRKKSTGKSWPGENASSVRATASATCTECGIAIEHAHAALQRRSCPV